MTRLKNVIESFLKLIFFIHNNSKEKRKKKNDNFLIPILIPSVVYRYFEQEQFLQILDGSVEHAHRSLEDNVVDAKCARKRTNST